MAMTEPLELFADPVEPPIDQDPVPMMRAEQRETIRSLFAALDVTTAREQFEVVSVLIGVRLQSVADLDAKSAAALIARLTSRVESKSRAKSLTGDPWADRDEDTWIDRL